MSSAFQGNAFQGNAFQIGALAAEEAAAAPEGWQAPLSRAPKAAGIALAALTQVFTPPAPAAAAPQGWQPPRTEIAANPRQARPTQPDYAFLSTAFTQNTTSIDKWLQPLSPMPMVRPRLSQPDYAFLDTQFTQNTVYIGNWQQPLSEAAPRPPVWHTQPDYVFPSTAFTQNTVYAGNWLRPLSVPLKIEQPDPTQPTFVVIPAGTPEGWQVPLSLAPPRSYAKYEQPSFVYPAPPFFVEYVNGWQYIQSSAPPRPPVWHGQPPFVYPVGQVFVQYVNGWQYVQSAAPPRPPVWHTQPDYTFQSTAFTQNTVTIDKWLQPLAGMPSVKPRPTQPDYAWRDTQFTQNTVYVGNWWRPLGVAAAVPPVWRTQPDYAWRDTQFTQNTVSIDRWQQPLSLMPLVRPRLSQPEYAWLDTQFTQNTVSIDKWLRPLAEMPSVKPRPTQPDYAWRDTQFTQNTVYIGGWQQALSRAVTILPAAVTQPVVVLFEAQQPRGWFVDLSIAAPKRYVPTYAAGYVPYVAPAVNTVTIDKWQQAFVLPPRPIVRRDGFVFNRLNAGQPSNSLTHQWYRPLSEPPRRAIRQPLPPFLWTVNRPLETVPPPPAQPESPPGGWDRWGPKKKRTGLEPVRRPTTVIRKPAERRAEQPERPPLEWLEWLLRHRQQQPTPWQLLDELRLPPEPPLDLGPTLAALQDALDEQDILRVIEMLDEQDRLNALDEDEIRLILYLLS